MRLTLTSMTAVMAHVEAITPKPHYRSLVCRSEVKEYLRRELPESKPAETFGDSLFGLRLYEKPGQLAAAWVFSDDRTAQKYLDGELSELDLVSLISDRLRPMI